MTPEMVHWLLALAVAAPLLALVLVPAARDRALALLPWAAVPALLTAGLVPDGTEFRLPALLHGATFAMDGTARVFLLPAAIVWLLAGWFANGWAPSGRTRFAGFWLAALAGNVVLILAQDLLTFYLGFALMTFTAYGLVMHVGSRKALRAGRLYLAMMIAGELALFTAVALVAVEAGAPDLTLAQAAEARSGVALALFGLGFGLKLGVLGLHGWLPQAHPVAPVPASAVLSGVIIKAGALGWWQISAPETSAPDAWGGAVLILGLAGVFYGVAAGLTERDPKTVLAWSSVSQMGFVVALAGLASQAPSAAPVAWAGIGVTVAYHGLAKGALFLGVGLAQSGPASGTARILLWLPALALTGAPLTGAALVKTALDIAAVEAGWGSWLVPVTYLTNVATTLLMARLLYRVHAMPQDDAAPGIQSPTVWLCWALLLLAALLVPWWVASPTLVNEAISLTVIRDATWPVALGAVAAATFILLPARPRPTPGSARRSHIALPIRPLLAQALLLKRMEVRLHHWHTVGQLAVLVILLTALALWPWGAH